MFFEMELIVREEKSYDRKFHNHPFKDIDQTKNIEGVMLSKPWLSKAYLDRELKKLIKNR